jgi:hypothetical protein
MKLGAAFSVLAVASTVLGFQLPVSRVKPQPPLSAGLERRGFSLAARGTIALKSSHSNNVYTSTMQIKGEGKARDVCGCL